MGNRGRNPGPGRDSDREPLPNGGAAAPCNPGAAYTPTANLNGWVTHAQDIGGITGIAEMSLTDNGAAID